MLLSFLSFSLTMACLLLLAQQELEPSLQTIDEFAEQAAAQSGKRLNAQMEAMASFMGRRSEEHSRARREGQGGGGADEEGESVGPSEGRSSDAAIREVLAAARKDPGSPDRPGGNIGPPPGAIKQGWLLMRHGDAWHRRFFVLEANGTLLYHRGHSSNYALGAGKAQPVSGASNLGKDQPPPPSPPPPPPQSQQPADRSGGAPAPPSGPAAPSSAAAAEGAPSSSADGPLDDPDIPYGVHEDAAELAGALTGLWSFGTSVLRGAIGADRNWFDSIGFEWI